MQFLRKDIQLAQPCQWPALSPPQLPTEGIRLLLVKGQHFEFQLDNPAHWLAEL